MHKDCIDKNWNDYIDFRHKYNHDSEKPNLELNIIEFFSEPSMLIISILAAVMIVFGMSYEAKSKFQKYVLKGSESSDITGQNTSNLKELGTDNRVVSINLHQMSVEEDLHTLHEKMNLLVEDMSSMKAALQVLSKRKKLKIKPRAYFSTR